MSRLTDLIAEAKAKDAALGTELEREFRALTQRRAFGLNFERHRPESVELMGCPVRRGDRVRILPPRGTTTEKTSQQIWRVQGFTGRGEARQAQLAADTPDAARTTETLGAPETTTAAVADLVVLVAFQDTIYPGLVPTGEVMRGGDKPSHTVINGENFHALKLLGYTHRGRVDAIYIDPPYNTGARDWKYNNDYVDDADSYRHSKWLAMMERRLLAARELLNPTASVLIVTIDEKEYLRLGLLLEQLFPDARIQMISSVINPSGSNRASAFGRTDEYLFMVMFGAAAPMKLILDREWKIALGQQSKTLRWNGLIRTGGGSRRSDRPNQFYPVYIQQDAEGPKFHSVGDAYFGDNWRREAPPVPPLFAIWPIRSDGSEGRWRVSAAHLRELIAKGYAKLGTWRDDATTISYLASGEHKKVEAGIFPVLGRRSDNSIIVDDSDYEPTFVPGTQWRISSHHAEQGGTNLLKRLVAGRKFPFPKSLYAVEDALRFFVADRPDAIILDFFAGSGTTAHAVMRLNRQDGGRRQCISITNNEVAADERKNLHQAGLRPGDDDWEQWGICNYITKPRIRAAITGKTPDGDAIVGDYKYNDEFPMADGLAENAAFFTLSYEAPVAVSHNRAFQRIAPLLWLRAGSRGRCIASLPPAGWAVADTYGILTNPDRAELFCAAIAATPGIRMAYIVTDDERLFQALARQLPDGVEPVRLYQSYLTNFRFSTGGKTP